MRTANVVYPKKVEKMKHLKYVTFYPGARARTCRAFLSVEVHTKILYALREQLDVMQILRSVVRLSSKAVKLGIIKKDILLLGGLHQITSSNPVCSRPIHLVHSKANYLTFTSILPQVNTNLRRNLFLSPCFRTTDSEATENTR